MTRYFDNVTWFEYPEFEWKKQEVCIFEKAFKKIESHRLKSFQTRANDNWIQVCRYGDNLLSAAFSSTRSTYWLLNGDFSFVLLETFSKERDVLQVSDTFTKTVAGNMIFTSKKRTLSYEVNRRLVYSMRSIGKGYSGAKKFCTLMNMPAPQQQGHIRKVQEHWQKMWKLLPRITCPVLQKRSGMPREPMKMMLWTVVFPVMVPGRKEHEWLCHSVKC